MNELLVLEMLFELLAQLFPPAVVSIALEAAFSKGVICITAACGRTALEFCFGGTRHFREAMPAHASSKVTDTIGIVKPGPTDTPSVTA